MMRTARKRQERLRIGRQQRALANDQEALKALMGALPPWVQFPDVERAEWVNRIVVGLWPYLKRATEDGACPHIAERRLRRAPALAALNSARTCRTFQATAAADVDDAG